MIKMPTNKTILQVLCSPKMVEWLDMKRTFTEGLQVSYSKIIYHILKKVMIAEALELWEIEREEEE